MAVDNTIQKIINGLEVLIVADGLNSIPDINVKENTDMTRLISEVVNMEISVDPSNENLVPAIFKSLNEKLSGVDNVVLNEINNISMKFASELESCFSVLKDDIAVKVKDLQNNIKERYVQYIKREGADSLLEENDNLNVTENDYVFIKWKNINTPSEMNTVISEACTNVNLTNHDINSFNLSVIKEKLLFKTSTIDTSPETIKEIEDALVEFANDDSYNLTDVSVRLFLNMLISENSYATYFNRILSTLIVNPANTVVELLSFCDNYITFADIVSKDKVGISDKMIAEAYSTFIGNVNAMMKTIYACLYICLHIKTTVFNNKLILTKNIINGDEYDKFVEEGHHIEEIYKFLKAFHRTIDVPTNGISTASIIVAETDKRLQQENVSIELESKIIKSRCLNLAYTSVTNEYAKPFLQQIYTDENSKYDYYLDKINRNIRIAKSALHGKFENLEDNLFAFIINSFYSDSLVSVLYESLGNEYSEMAKKSSTIEESDIISANIKTASDIILSYLVNKLCI